MNAALISVNNAATKMMKAGNWIATIPGYAQHVSMNMRRKHDPIPHQPQPGDRCVTQEQIVKDLRLLQEIAKRCEDKLCNALQSVDYSLPEMPNGEFVREVYYLTHAVAKCLQAEPHNEQFMALEKLLRDYVWKACQRASLNKAGFGEYPECSGNASDCPENEGFGCCKK